MQGKKAYQEKLFTQFRMRDWMPKENFYRRLKRELDLLLTCPYNGDSGQKRIDPTVLFTFWLGVFATDKLFKNGKTATEKIIVPLNTIKINS